jgi:hypothetical protein
MAMDDLVKQAKQLADEIEKSRHRNLAAAEVLADERESALERSRASVAALGGVAAAQAGTAPVADETTVAAL